MTRWLNGNRNPDKDKQPHVNFFPYTGESGGAPGLDELTKLSAGGATLTSEQKKEFVEVTSRLKLLDDRRKLLLARTGDEYVTDPPKLAAKQ